MVSNGLKWLLPRYLLSTNRPRSVSMFSVVSINQRSLPTPTPPKTPHYTATFSSLDIDPAMAQDTPILERNPSLKPVDILSVLNIIYMVPVDIIY